MPRATTQASTQAAVAAIPSAEGANTVRASSSRTRQVNHALIGRIRNPCEKEASEFHFSTMERKVGK